MCFDNTSDVERVITRYQNHPSVVEIQTQHAHKSFSFTHVEPSTVYRVIKSLDPRKAVSGSIPTKILKSMADIVSIPLTDCINSSVNNEVFPFALKYSEVSPVYKKDNKLSIKNYRPISILPVLSKVYERVIFDQLNSYFSTIFSPHLCGFRKGHSTQHALLRMSREWLECLDSSGIVGTVLMDLSKAFDSLNHDLLIAKLAAYGVDLRSCRFIKSYLSNRFQRTKIDSFFSQWTLVLLGVPQGSILGPLLFNVFINDLLLILKNICNFADDNTIYVCGNSLHDILTRLKADVLKSCEWFSTNMLVVNTEKFQMMFLGCPSENVKLNLDGTTALLASDSVKLLGITLDKRLSFENHVSSLCKKATTNVICLNRIRSFINYSQAKSLFESYIVSSFSYAPIVWMFCSKTSMKSIEIVHKRAVRALCNNFVDSYDDLLAKYDIKTVHEIHLRYLLCEIYKTLHFNNPDFMQNLFRKKRLPIICGLKIS